MLYSQYRFWDQLSSHRNPQAIGYILAYVCMPSILVQGMAVGRLSAAFEDHTLIFGSMALMALSMVDWAVAPNLEWLPVVLAQMSLACGVLNTVVSSAMMKAVPPRQFGGVLGLWASVESFIRIIPPAAGGVLLQQLSTGAPGIVGALVLGGLAYFI